MRWIKTPVLVCCFLLACGLFADNVKLRDGRVLENPRVLSKTPEGLEVGHSKGIIYLKFSDLPEDIQKKYNYDPAKAVDYRIKRDEAKKRYKAAKKQQELADAREEAKHQRIREKVKLAQVEKNIAELEQRVAFLEKEIPKLEANRDQYFQERNKLASAPTQNNSHVKYYGWRGGFVRGGGGRVDSSRRKVIKSLNEEYAVAKDSLTEAKQELFSVKNKLARLRKKREHLTKKSESIDKK